MHIPSPQRDLGVSVSNETHFSSHRDKPLKSECHLQSKGGTRNRAICRYAFVRYKRYSLTATINKALERLTFEGTMMRVARGIYCYPMIARTFGAGPCPPSTDDIAKAVARRDGAKIVPAEAWAQYQLGLTQQVPMNVIFLTNGPSRTIATEDGLSIRFKHASPRYFAMKNIVACMMTTALKGWKVENLSMEQIDKVKAVVENHGPFPAEDMKLMPASVRELIQSFERKEKSV